MLSAVWQQVAHDRSRDKRTENRPSLADECGPKLTRDLLDRVVPNHPAVVMNTSIALCLCELAGDLRGGHHRRDHGSARWRARPHRWSPQRVLRGDRCHLLLLPAIPTGGPDKFNASLLAIMSDAARRGVTKIHDAATGALFGAAELDLLHGLAADGQLPVRISTAQIETAREALERAGVYALADDDLVRAVSWKLVSDGSNQGAQRLPERTVPGSDSCGKPNYELDEVVEIIRRAHEAVVASDGALQWRRGHRAGGDGLRADDRWRPGAGPLSPHRALLPLER